MFFYPVNHVNDGLLAAHINGHGCTVNTLSDLSCTFTITISNDNVFSTLSCKPFTHLASDTAGAPCDHNNFARQFHSYSPELNKRENIDVFGY